jgi:hypothetical protein
VYFTRATGWATKEGGLRSIWIGGFYMFFVNPTRAKHFAAMVMIGDGVMAMIDPERDAKAWKKGPKVWRDFMHSLSKRPNLTRAIGMAQVAGGIWWALKQEEME